jgi:erythritol transport system permease protein
MKLRTFVALILVVIAFSFIAPNFFTVQNMLVMATHITVFGVLSLGMTFVMLTAGIDLSVGSVVGLAGMISGWFINQGIQLGNATIYLSLPAIILVVLLLGVAVGSINGFFITRFGVPPFIATLGMLHMGRGFAMLTSGGQTFPNLDRYPLLHTLAQSNPSPERANEAATAIPGLAPGNVEAMARTGFEVMGTEYFLGVPIMVWIMIGLAILFAWVSKKTRFGRHIYAVGGNEEAARLSGVRVNRIKMLVYMISGACAALVGIMLSSKLVASHPATGETYELTTIACVVLGGTSLMGGRGTILGSVIGACVIVVLSDGLVMAGVSSMWQKVFIGAVIVAAVVLDHVQQRVEERRATAAE